MSPNSSSHPMSPPLSVCVGEQLQCYCGANMSMRCIGVDCALAHEAAGWTRQQNHMLCGKNVTEAMALVKNFNFGSDCKKEAGADDRTGDK